MNFITHSFRHAEIILNEPAFIEQLEEVVRVIVGISDEDLILKHEIYGRDDIEKTPKSLSRAINELLKERFTELGWSPESNIFKDRRYQGDNWRLDFAKNDISIEVAFNHATVIAWNLTKPVLASELNHVEKAIQTQIGIIITATEKLKRLGGFDGAIGTFEGFKEYLPPMRNVLTAPLLIIGLEPPKTFVIEEYQHAPRKKIGKIKRI